MRASVAAMWIVYLLLCCIDTRDTKTHFSPDQTPTNICLLSSKNTAVVLFGSSYDRHWCKHDTFVDMLVLAPFSALKLH